MAILNSSFFLVFSKKFPDVWHKQISHGLNLILHRIIFCVMHGKKSTKTRMHSSRMRTDRCSGRH